MKRTVLSAEYDRGFYERRPSLYRDFLSEDFRTPLGQFGVECGPGWRGILERLSDALEAELAAGRVDACCAQVKQKFGELRFYVLGACTPAMREAISRAEEECSRTCELCGKPASRIGWSVLCDEHRDRRTR